MAQRTDDETKVEGHDALDRAMKVTFDSEEMTHFFDGFEPLEDGRALWERFIGGSEDA